MYIDFEKFKDRKRDGSPRYIKCCRISEEQKKQLKDFANHNNLNLTEALNCAIDYGCEKMIVTDSNNQIRSPFAGSFAETPHNKFL